MTSRILIIDYGSQYTQLIARNIRENSVYSEVHPFNKITKKLIKKIDPCGIILSGGPNSVLDNNSPQLSNIIINIRKPILGICYGFQLISKYFGGTINKSINREYGYSEINVIKKSKIIPNDWLDKKKIKVWMSHGDHVLKIPNNFSIISYSKNKIISAVEDKKRKIYGLQFHPEVIHTFGGKKILKKFVFDICKSKRNWILDDFITRKTEEIKKNISKNKVICALSGGVDSTVVSYLLHKAVGKKLYCIFVDHGLLRKGEAEEVKKFFTKKFDNNFIYVNASKIFLNNLKNISDPEMKRKIIGRTFIKIFENEAKKIRNVKFLAQGTLYPDVVESIPFFGGPSVKIKSHHNVGGLPKKMNLKIIEPLRYLFKDEVRLLAIKLNIKKDLITKHPFPGPGLAIRIPGKINKEKLEILRNVDHIYINFLKEKKIYSKIWQALVILLPVKSVGVMGDERTYSYSCVLRAVTSIDGMTADYYFFKKNHITEVSNRIVNNIKQINRVLFDFTSKPPGTIEWE